MPSDLFVHLHTHSAYSLLEGAVHISGLRDLCLKHDMPALAVTDTNNLFGALEASETLSAAGLQSIAGLQISTVVPAAKSDAAAIAGHLVLLAQNAEGYANLMRLASKAYLDPADQGPSCLLETVEAYSDGLICLSGGAGGLLDSLMGRNCGDAASALAARLAAAFPGRFYVELQRHGRPEEIAHEARLIEIAYGRALPVVATNDVYFAAAEDYGAHDALICVAEGAHVDREDRRRLTPEHYFKSPAEMRALFADLPEAVENTVEIARRCAFRPRSRAPILPNFLGRDVSEGSDKSDRTESEAVELDRQAREGLKARLDRHGAFAPETEYWARLEHELKIIKEMGFPGYFLIVADFIKWAKRQDIPVGPGRGSGAGSLVAWALTITDLDPLRFGLLFERFLNPERVSMPDFDIDFCQDRRDEVIQYVAERYGADRVAQIITFGKLQARAVLRDVGRVLGMPYGQVDRLCKMVPNNPADPVTLEQAIADEPRLREAAEAEPEVRELLDKSLKLEGLYRHASTHAAGVVIGDRPLSELVPLYRDQRSEMPATQFNMRWVEPAGLVKFDFLGLKTLTVLQRAVEFLRERGIALDLADLPLDDEKTFEMLGEGASVGVFQLESAGMRSTLKSMKPASLEEIIALVSLYRPGPMDNIPTYIERKFGREEPDYLHPLLEPILKETYGVIIYQEQVMQIAQILSGYSLGEADLLRRAMGKKKKEEMDRQRSRFIEGAKANRVDAKTASGIFDLVAKFAGYGFNKSHAAAYALIAYQTAYLKANYPAEFLAASMSLDRGNTDKLAVFVQEAKAIGVGVDGPDVARSCADFSVRGGRIRYALAALKNVGFEAARAIERARGPGYSDMADFARKLDPAAANKRLIESLAAAGAFDALCANRARVYDGASAILGAAQLAASERNSAQAGLFGDAAPGVGELCLPDRPEWTALERCERENAALGFYFSDHPLDQYADALAAASVSTVQALRAAGEKAAGAQMLAGVVRNVRYRKSKSGRPFAWVGLSDQTGDYEATVFSEVLAGARDLLEAGALLLIGASVDFRDGDLRIAAESVRALEEASAAGVVGMRVYINAAEAARTVKNRLEAARREGDAGKSGGRLGDVALVLLASGPPCREVEIRLPEPYPIAPSLASALKAAKGVETVELMRR